LAGYQDQGDFFARKSVAWGRRHGLSDIRIRRAASRMGGGVECRWEFIMGSTAKPFFADPCPIIPGCGTESWRRRRAMFACYSSATTNYFRNFETLFRGTPLLQEKLKGRKVSLLAHLFG